MTDWLAFYTRFFQSPDLAARFVEACEAQTSPSNVAKIIMHQAQRLISLAEDIPHIRPKRESLQVFFLTVCAEAVAKLHAGPTASLGSRQAVHDFFCLLVPEPHRTAFGDGFTTFRHEPLGPSAAADVLYDIRCSVAHEGNYWSFTLGAGTPMGNAEPEVIARLRSHDLTEITIHGCINAAELHL